MPEAQRYQITGEWSITLGPSFQKRFEADSLVYVGRGRSIWVNAWDSGSQQGVRERLEWIKKERSPSALRVFEPAHPTIAKYAYLLLEQDDERGARWALYAYDI